MNQDHSPSVPSSVSELIDRWETIGAFATDAGCGYEAARKMRSRGSIAPRNWDGVIAAANEKGIPGIDIQWMATAGMQKAG